MAEKRHGGLTRAEQVDVIERAKSGDRDAMDAACRSLSPLVRKIAEKWAIRYPYSSVDWYEEGMFHLVRKLCLYDPARGAPSTFVTFAVDRLFVRLMRVDARRVDSRQEYAMAVPSAWTVAADPRTLEEVPDAWTDSPADEFDPTPLLRAVAQLDNPRQRAVIRARYGLMDEADEPMSLKDVGERIGVTKERVRQIQRKAEELLRLKLAGVYSESA